MKKVFKIKTLLIMQIILSFLGCKKGEQGPAGKDGTVNVTHATFSVSPWSSNSTRWFTKLSVPEITSETLNSAAIQAYVSVTPDSWMAIPTTVVSSTDYYWGF